MQWEGMEVGREGGGVRRGERVEGKGRRGGWRRRGIEEGVEDC